LTRVALKIQYDGSNYSGWQRQKQAYTVQESLEGAIKLLTKQDVKTFAAGRTDAGVHASGQVVHFDSNFKLPENRWSAALNGKLPRSIRILDSVNVSNEWHACYSAIYRHYRYVINNSKFPNIFLSNWSWHRYQKILDDLTMRDALKGMVGQHDFYAFQKKGSNRINAVTTIKDIKVIRMGELLLIDIKATGFLYGMVRAIVGQLVLVGEKKISPHVFYERWVNKKKEEVLESAPAKGLCFINAVYDRNIFSQLGNQDLFPKFLISDNS
tara:strand:+ start:2275 stop:3081 length:807 start_codon:yes stop_codon:yes gene_type:complete